MRTMNTLKARLQSELLYVRENWHIGVAFVAFGGLFAVAGWCFVMCI